MDEALMLLGHTDGSCSGNHFSEGPFPGVIATLPRWPLPEQDAAVRGADGLRAEDGPSVY
jgi:hypothetical protein